MEDQKTYMSSAPTFMLAGLELKEVGEVAIKKHIDQLRRLKVEA
jgi:hypothetical protein